MEGEDRSIRKELPRGWKMAVAVTTRTTQARQAECSSGKETLIIRDGEVVAVLAEGDPLLYLLRLPVDRLRMMRRRLEPVFKRRLSERMVFEAILEFKEGRLARPAVGGMRW
jgi:hypothetical protein